MPFQPQIKLFGNHAILVEWPAKIDKKILKNVLKRKNYLENLKIKEILYITNTYNSLLINYNATIENIYDELSKLKSIFSYEIDDFELQKSHWQIPVCYDEKYALDLNDLSVQNKLSKSEIISRHSDAIYTVYFIGFLPGFLYLGGLDKQLHFNRKSEPRLSVEKGSVGIGGQQTGIYPKASPGGWNIIGNSPIELFDIKAKNPCFAKAGDSVTFKSIGIDEHHFIKTQVSYGTFDINTLRIE